MRHLLLFFALFACAVPSFAKSDRVTIDKETCTITKDGKTYPLYGKIQIVTNYPDITIKFVQSYADINVKLVDNMPSCAEWMFVGDSEYYPDLKIKIVEDYPDIEVKIVEEGPGVR